MFIVQHVRMGLARSLRVWARFICAELGLATGDPGIWMDGGGNYTMLGVQQHTAQRNLEITTHLHCVNMGTISD